MNVSLLNELVNMALEKEEIQLLSIDDSSVADSMVIFQIDYTNFGTAKLIITQITETSYLFNAQYTSRGYATINGRRMLEVREDRKVTASRVIMTLLVETRIGGDMSCQ